MGIITKTFAEPPICKDEILRYAGCTQEDEATAELLESCLSEVRNKLTYKVCYIETDVFAEGDICDFGLFEVKSKKLAQNLNGVERAVLFAATIGIEADRLIAKYGRLSPSRAFMFQAIGAERIEALCDEFCDKFMQENAVALKPRFSPGYGDLSLDTQKQVFDILGCSKRIGLYLNESLLMTPSKSVTAFAGITKTQTTEKKSRCNYCDKSDCAFRRKI